MLLPTIMLGRLDSITCRNLRKSSTCGLLALNSKSRCGPLWSHFLAADTPENSLHAPVKQRALVRQNQILKASAWIIELCNLVDKHSRDLVNTLPRASILVKSLMLLPWTKWQTALPCDLSIPISPLDWNRFAEWARMTWPGCATCAHELSRCTKHALSALRTSMIDAAQGSNAKALSSWLKPVSSASAIRQVDGSVVTCPLQMSELIREAWSDFLCPDAHALVPMSDDNLQGLVANLETLFPDVNPSLPRS